MLVWRAVVCLSAIKVYTWFFPFPIRITVWSGFACWNGLKNKSRGVWGAHELQRHIFFPVFCRSQPNPFVLSMQITSLVWYPFSCLTRGGQSPRCCCLHLRWLTGLSGLSSSSVVWESEWSNKAIHPKTSPSKVQTPCPLILEIFCWSWRVCIIKQWDITCPFLQQCENPAVGILHECVFTCDAWMHVQMKPSWSLTHL